MQRPLQVLGLAALAIVLTGCAADAPRTAPATTTAAMAPAAPDARVTTLWSASCALCHVDGNGGAPRVGHADEWRPRLAKGSGVLLQHTLEGFNDMPPLGYCMACERADFEALIRFMAESG
jgi:cytochrome c5